jgi:hypothetical protein
VRDKDARLCAGHSDTRTELDCGKLAVFVHRGVFCVGIGMKFISGLIGERRTCPERDNHVFRRAFVQGRLLQFG